MKNGVKSNLSSKCFMSLQKEVQKIEAATKTIQGYLPRLSAPKLVRNFFLIIWGGVILWTPLAVYISNSFFNFYYAVPEVPKYIKTSAYQTALVVNNQISRKIENAYLYKLSQINPEGIKVGVQTNHLEGIADKLNVKGSLVATTVNDKTGTVNAKPLEFVSAYKVGIQSSYAVGNKYYDVDLSVNGSQKGLIANKSGLDEINEMTLFTASIGLIDQADQALRINLNSFLNQSSDREYSLRTYLTYLKNVELSMKNTQVKVDQGVAQLKAAEAIAQAKMTQTESDFFIALNKFDQNKTYQNLDKFVVDYQSQVDKKANLQAMNQIVKYFDGYLPLLTERVAAVEANRNALVNGITVVAFENVDLGLIEIN